MCGRLLILVCYLVFLCGVYAKAQTEAKFDFVPGEELTYKIEIKNHWRDTAKTKLPDWAGEMKVWPFERKADGTTVLRARSELTSVDPNTPKAPGGTLVEWAEITIDASGRVTPYHFQPSASITPSVPLAFPLPDQKAGALNWKAPGPEDAVFDYSLAPGTSLTNSPWQIDIVHHWPRYEAQGIHTHEQIIFNLQAGRVSAWHLYNEYDSGPWKEREMSATFEKARKLSPTEFARVQEDSRLLLDTLAELRQLITTAPDKAEELDPYKQRVEKLTQALSALPRNIQEVAFKNDLQRFSLRLISSFVDSAQENVDKMSKQTEQLIDKASPDWTTQDISGQTHSLKDYRGKIILLDFWNRECGPRLISMPFLKNIEEDYKDRPLVVIGLDNFDSMETFRETAQILQLNNPQFMGDKIAELYDVVGDPVYVLIDEQGIVRFRQEGWDGGVDKILRTQIDAYWLK